MADISQIIHSINTFIKPMGLQAALRVFGDDGAGQSGIYFFKSPHMQPINAGTFVESSSAYGTTTVVFNLTQLATARSQEEVFFLSLEDVLSGKLFHAGK